MSRTLSILTLALIATFFAYRHLDRTYRDENPRYEQLLALVEPPKVSADTVAGLGLVLPSGLEWVYLKEENAWRIPQYHFAYASDAPGNIVKALTQAQGFPIRFGSRPAAFYGFADNVTRLALYDIQGQPFLEVLCGGGIPGSFTSESYVQIAGSDTIYHIDQRPLASFRPSTTALPPLLDQKVIPSALTPQGTLTRLRFIPEAQWHLPWVERRKRTTAEGLPARASPDPYRDLPQYDWFAPIHGQDVEIDEQWSRELLQMVTQLQFDQIPPQEGLESAKDSPNELTIQLQYDVLTSPKNLEEQTHEAPEIITEAIRLRSASSDNNWLVSFSGNDLICLISQQKLDQLFRKLKSVKPGM